MGAAHKIAAHINIPIMLIFFMTVSRWKQHTDCASIKRTGFNRSQQTRYQCPVMALVERK